MEIINPLGYPAWDDLVGSNPAGSFFHTTNWARVLKESYGYTPKYFTILTNGTLQALIPIMEIDSALTGRRGVSLPFSDYSEPFAENAENYRRLVEEVVRYGKKAGWKTIEIRGGEGPWKEARTYSEYYGHRKKLNSSEKELFTCLRTNMQRNVNKALKNGISVVFLKSADAIDVYYRLHCITRKKHGIPPQPRIFFRKIHEHILSRDMGFVALASYNNNVIAGSVYFHFDKQAIYKYGASNDIGRNYRANNLIMWEAIKLYSRNGYECLLFGRTECYNRGLRDYKMGYGVEEYGIKYYKYNIRKNKVMANSVFPHSYLNKTFRHIPIPLSRAIGELLYKHIG